MDRLNRKFGSPAFSALFLATLSGVVLWFFVFAVQVATRGVL